MEVSWVKCKGSIFCDLFKLDVAHKNLTGLEGVYIVWTGADSNRKVLRVGCGDIQKEFIRLRKDLSMQAFSHLGASVTWTVVDENRHHNILAFLIQKYQPSIVENNKVAKPIEVNLPW